MKISQKIVVKVLLNISNPTNNICKSCQLGKQPRTSFKTKEHSTSRPLELVQIDLCDPTRTQTLQGERYFMLFIDDYTRMVCVTYIKKKYESFDKFKMFKALVENESDYKIKCLQSKNGGEFTSNEFNRFCEKHVIKRQFFGTRTLQQNGVVAVQDAIKTMLFNANLLEIFWREAVSVVVYIISRA